MNHRYSILVCMVTVVLMVAGCASKTPLIKAAASGDSAVVEKLISEGTNVNEPDDGGYTPLMHAIWSGKTETVKVLLSRGADVNAKDKNGSTPLLHAISYGYLDIIKILIGKGANLESKDLEGFTPLTYATNCTYPSPNSIDVIKLLIKSGANINEKDPEGETVLDFALSSTQGDVVDDLIKVGNVNNLWVPETGKARLFFIGTGLWDYNTVYIGNLNKRLNRNKYVGLAFIDVDPGKHVISVSEKPATPKPILSIEAIKGQTYYFEVTQDMKRRALHYAMVKLSNVMIAPLAEVEAKQKFKEILKSKEIK